ncbi:MAG: hypothetical protein Q7R77_03200 [Candidatus Daviesbacteria bacterium]|nr:hypothetical protein [Candidatus Daviesbacteria bacterium]
MSLEFNVHDLIADIDRALRKGTFNTSPEKQPADPEIQRFEQGLMRRYLSSVLPSSRLKTFKEQSWDIELLARYCAGEFKKWQDITQDRYRKDGTETKADVVKSITLAGVADFALNQFHEFSAASGQAHPNSRRHKDMLERADYWGWTERVIRKAAEGKSNYE